MQSIQLASQQPTGSLPQRAPPPPPTASTHNDILSIFQQYLLAPRHSPLCERPHGRCVPLFMCELPPDATRPILVREAVPQTLLVLVRRILSTYSSAVNPTCCAASTPSQPSAWMGRRACGVGALHAGALSGLRRCMGQTLFPQSSHRIEHPSYIHPSTP